MPNATRRPTSAKVLAAALLLAAILAAGAGLAASWVSNCCGSADPADPAPAVLGLGTAALLVVAAYGLASGAMRPAWLIGLTAALPGACLVAAPSSSDLATLAPFAVLGWAGFAWLVSRPRTAAWLRGDR